jgi:hypothetical protein
MMILLVLLLNHKAIYTRILTIINKIKLSGAAFSGKMQPHPLLPTFFHDLCDAGTGPMLWSTHRVLFRSKILALTKYLFCPSPKILLNAGI